MHIAYLQRVKSGGFCIKAERKQQNRVFAAGFSLLQGSFRPLNVLCLAKLPRTGCPQGVCFIDFQICFLFFFHPWSPSAEHQHLDTLWFENSSTDVYVCWARGITGQLLRLCVTWLTHNIINHEPLEKGETENRHTFCFQIIFLKQLIHLQILILTHLILCVCVFFIVTPFLSCCTVNDTECGLTLIGVSRGRRRAPVGAAINERVTIHR